MAHHTLKNSYSHLSERLNRFPQGAPPSEYLFKILSILFTAKEAELVSTLPIKPFTVEKAARIWKLDLNSTRKILDSLADKAILVDVERNGESVYALPPPMAGFFEFSLMRYTKDIDQKALAELFESEKKALAASPGDAEKLLAVGDSAVPDNLDPVELGAWMMVSRAILNLSETVSKN